MWFLPDGIVRDMAEPINYAWVLSQMAEKKKLYDIGPCYRAWPTKRLYIMELRTVRIFHNPRDERRDYQTDTNRCPPGSQR